MNGLRVDCLAGGEFSLIASVPRCVVQDDGRADWTPEDLQPVYVHLTACKRHVGKVNHWLSHLADPVRQQWPELDMDTEPLVLRTDVLREHWEKISGDLGYDESDVFRLVAAG